ncbi:hypothetical protein [Nitrosospira lacus]|uniref:hypothetical protein n=1 Tax=Nitrosospira lacus TaxID=1288494 RepID=UPI00125F5E4C|nr:hypothetical protein [Nitrosospira lacus]
MKIQTGFQYYSPYAIAHAARDNFRAGLAKYPSQQFARFEGKLAAKASDQPTFHHFLSGRKTMGLQNPFLPIIFCFNSSSPAGC